MKIGILTLPLEKNYGGILQAFALQKVLRGFGHDVITIDRHNRNKYPSFTIHLLGFIKRLLFRLFLHKNVSIKWDPFESENEYRNRIRPNWSRLFVERNIHLTHFIYQDQLKAIDNEYKFNAYVVGSDQVWLSKYCPNSFLDFVTRANVKKIIYAASCGKYSMFDDNHLIKKCEKLARDFVGISVREDYLEKLCKERLHINTEWVLDPTMLLEPKDYLNATENTVGTDSIVFSYILDETPSKRYLVDMISKELRIPYVDGNVSSENVDETNHPSVDDWIHNIKRAKYVITDSFHGTAFSILFNKPFIAIGNELRGIN